MVHNFTTDPATAALVLLLPRGEKPGARGEHRRRHLEQKRKNRRRLPRADAMTVDGGFDTRVNLRRRDTDCRQRLKTNKAGTPTQQCHVKNDAPPNVTARTPRDPRCPLSPISMLQNKMGPQRPAARRNIEVGVARGAWQSLTVGLRPSERARSPTARSEQRSWGRLRAELDLRSTHAPGGLVHYFLHLRLPSWGTVVD